MSLQIIPTGDGTDTFYRQTTTLDGVPYLLEFSYNQREDSWYLSVSTNEGEDIYDGVKLVCNWNLLRSCADPRKPPGALLVVSATTDLSDPGLADLAPSGRCSLGYVPKADLASIKAGTE